MKKVIIASIVAGAMAISAQAALIYNVDVLNNGGFDDAIGSGGGIIPNPGDQALTILYFVGDNGVIDPVVNIGGVSGDDVIIGSYLTANNGGASENYAIGGGNIQNPTYSGADVFARIFNTANAAAGSAFYTHSIQSVSAWDDAKEPSDVPTSYIINTGIIQAANTGTVIPEPATIGLMGIAGLGMYLARRKVRS